ncbi:hypothetical protein [Exiguobacterium aestuarii]|uniref:hypothetical protein n=1 Tax=Exiguobacterium aestuarii TaxID=273527 RepID=UPI001CD1D72E|nr:hypothetical protein [Exiguobacterium aestuarii]MCA0981102.1 hypothetical protein [Exiguobacterium aestuarii]
MIKKYIYKYITRRNNFHIKIEEIITENNQIKLEGYILSRKSSIDVSKILFYQDMNALKSRFYERDDVKTAYSDFSTNLGFELYIPDKNNHNVQEKIIVKYKRNTFFLNIPQYLLERIYLEQERCIFGYSIDMHRKRKAKISKKMNSH